MIALDPAARAHAPLGAQAHDAPPYRRETADIARIEADLVDARRALKSASSLRVRAQ
jgi:hypothetical protein